MEKKIWFITFIAYTPYGAKKGWTTLCKDDYPYKEDAQSKANLIANNVSSEFCNFSVTETYVTDSISEFKNKCIKVGLNPNLQGYE